MTLAKSAELRELSRQNRANALFDFDAHCEDTEFGYRFLAGQADTVGESMAERAARQICRVNRWWSVVGKK